MNSLKKERKTIGIRICIFCEAHHGTSRGKLCAACTELQDYAEGRLDRCPFGENRSTCAKCRIHCYKPEMRKRVTEVMRYAGPRMMTRHPLLAIGHLLKSVRSQKAGDRSFSHKGTKSRRR